MDLDGSPLLPNKTKGINKNDSSVSKEKSEISQPSNEVNDIDPMVQRCVIIQKDEKGYGLTVSGDNPVFVQSVKEDGAAARAGVQQGDRIIKVNGTLVTQSNHQEVVERIKSGSYVALTLLGKPSGQGKGSLSPQQSFNLTGNNASVLNSNKVTTSDRITGPQPVDPEKQQQLTNSRIHTIRKMLEKEVTYLENLRTEFSKTPSEKIRAEVSGAMKRVKTLEEQLFNLTGIPYEHTAVKKSPKSPSSVRHSHEKENFRSVSYPTPGHHNRSLTHQVSAPLLPANQVSIQTLSPVSPESCDPKYQVMLIPTNEKVKDSTSSDLQKQSFSTSLENLVILPSPKTTTWPQPTHTRQSSSPESLIHGIETLKCQKSNGCTVPRTESLYRSPSAVSNTRYKNATSPEIETKFSSPLNTSRGSSIGQYESAAESPSPSPCVTPPEPLDASRGTNTDLFISDEATIHTQDEQYRTPPECLGEVNMQHVISKLGQNPSIICMEDDDFSSDTEISHLEDHGPFNGLWKLVRNPAHLAVFIHYLISNSDPSSIFFYLISDLYEQGSGKEMKKWAYEIHSSFLVPGAPLKVSLVDETILHEIDEVLLNHIEKEDILRTVFRKARKKAKHELNDLLAEFRIKRTMGLANIYGPPDYQLEEAINDKNKELKIIEQLLIPCFESVYEELEGTDDRAAAKALALSTVLKQFGVKSQQALSLLERYPSFVAKEKSRLRFLQRNKKVMFIQGHHFVPQHYYCVTYCNHCQLIIWGVGMQGSQCQNCEMNVHKACVRIVEEHCIGSLRNKKDKKKDRMSGIMENIIGKSRKPSHPVPSAIEKAKRINDELNSDNGFPSDSYHSETSDTGERGPEDFKEPSDVIFQNMLNLSESLEKNAHMHSFKKSAPSSIGRSESFRQRRESKPSFRKRSDPNIPRSKSDVDVDDKHASGLNESRSSSNSSLSNRSLDSPSNSSEMVHRTPTSISADSVPTNFAPSSLTSSGNHNTSTNIYDDSDLEAETDPPNWKENVDAEVLKLMKPKEKKRQDVINELFHTERTHVRNLKVLDKLFYKPMLQEQLLSPDFLNLLFPNLEEMLEIHSNFNNKMKTRRSNEPVIGDIGKLMLEMFDGEAGEHLKQAAATYCKNQSIALESLKIRQKKDQKLAQILSDAELNNLCRRLQLKDIIASGCQRLTKYPLLLENIAKYTPPNTQELLDVQRAFDCSKEILVHVDTAIKEAENMHKLLEIQKKLEKSSFEKTEHPIVHSFKNLDVTKHKLLHEGPLTWRLNKQKTLEMHVVLLEDILILFQKQDDKYILKFHNTNLTTGREDTKIMYSPILRVHNLLIRNNASDKRGIFLISSSEMHAMYEFVAATPAEKKRWCQHLNKAVEQKMQSGTLIKNNHETSQNVSDPVLPPEEPIEETDNETKDADNSLETSQEARAYQTDMPVDDNKANESEVQSPDVTPDVVPQRAKQVPSDEETSESERGDRSQRKIQHIEILQITEGLQLIEPSEVIVSTGAVFETAEPVLTPLEKLRRKDQEIKAAIEEKEQILSNIFQIPLEEYKTDKELPDDTKEMSALDLLLIAVQQATKLSSFINDGLNLTEDSSCSVDINAIRLEEGATNSLPSDTPSLNYLCKLQGVSHKNLLPLSTSLNKCLNQLMPMIADMEDERKQLRKELLSCREQIHLLHENHRHCFVQSHSPSTHSRPSSFVSVASTTSDGISDFPEHQHLFSVLEKTEETAAALEPELTQDDSFSNLKPSSPENEDMLPIERFDRSEANEAETRTQCDENSICDLENLPISSPSCSCECEEDTTPIETNDDSLCNRTVSEELKVDPVYL